MILGKKVDVLTFEIEHVNLDALKTTRKRRNKRLSICINIRDYSKQKHPKRFLCQP